MDLIGQTDPEWWLKLVGNVGVAGAVLLMLALAIWRSAPSIAKAAVKYFETATATQESNAKALETLSAAQTKLTLTSVASGENHAKSHKAGIVAANALQAFAESHSSQAGAAVRPHVEKIIEILDQ